MPIIEHQSISLMTYTNQMLKRKEKDITINIQPYITHFHGNKQSSTVDVHCKCLITNMLEFQTISLHDGYVR